MLATCRIALASACVFIGACGAPPDHPRTAASSPPSPTKTSSARAVDDPLAMGSSFKTYTSTRFHFTLPLPDSASFRVEDKTDRWFVATHEPTTSTMLVRVWREYGMMNRTSCEEQARLYRVLPEVDRGVRIDERRIDVPAEHDTVVHVHVQERKGAPHFEGTVLAFGGLAHRCFAFVFVTTDDSEATVAERLSNIVHGSLERMTFQDDLAPQRKPLDLKSPVRLDMPSGAGR
mgnify:CR=1 FL=1